VQMFSKIFEVPAQVFLIKIWRILFL
jgi:hypothetical protein